MKERNILIGILVILSLLTYGLEVLAGEHTPAVMASLLIIGIGFCSFIYYSHSKKENKSSNFKSDYKPFVSIIIPAKNEENVIERTVNNIMEIDYKKDDNTPNFEVIIIDDGSTDKTPNILNSLKNKYSNLFINQRLPIKFSNKAKALNSTLPIFEGEILCIFDSDAQVPKDFLTKAIKYFNDPEVGAVQVRKKIINSNENLLTLCQSNELDMSMELEAQRDKNSGFVSLWGNGMLVRKQALLKVGGWNNNALTEDSDMATILHLNGWKVKFCNDTYVQEEAVTKLTQFIKQRFRWAEGNIRGCLNYFIQIIHTPMPLAKKVDMLASILAFALPIWMAMDLLFLISDKSRDIVWSIVMYIVIALIGGLWINITSGFRFLNNKKLKTKFMAIFHIILNGFYSLHWVPIAIIVILKVLLNKKQSVWFKTEHGFNSKYKIKV